ncbi:hypothetical protein H5410_037568 [Solanum commersonii]|uniref:Uncharacterized protein n=1 Tax=Solanum commersonii TaxID=4109 RepID=A0A9J5Y9W5_SOLCO|nr:hypothetical protein H5410_037568 [Solanum commersonii]
MWHHLPSFVTFNARVLPVDTEGTPQNTCKQRINIEAKMLYLTLIIWILLSHFLWTRTDFILCHSQKNVRLIRYNIQYNYVYDTQLTCVTQKNQITNCVHIDVSFYYLRKKSKLRSMDQYRYTTCNCLFNTYIKNAYKMYYCSPADDTLSTQQHIARADVVSVYKKTINTSSMVFLSLLLYHGIW